MCLIGSGSRTGWIALASVSLFLLAFGGAGRRWITVQAGFAASGLVLWVLFFAVVPSLFDVSTTLETARFSNFASVASRRILWTLGVEAALQHPLFGIGPMHFAYFNNHEGAHPHNFWLQLARRMGHPAAMLLGCTAVVFFARLARDVSREGDQARQDVGLALLASVTAWGIGTLADGYMVVPTSQTTSTVVLMLAAMWLRQSETRQSVSTLATWIPRYLLVALCGVALTVLVALPFTRFGQPTEREFAWRAEHPGVPMWPRFWQQGWIGPEDDVTARDPGLQRLQ